MTVQIAEKAAPSTATFPFSDEDWQLNVSITDVPRPVASDDCDTSDGCESTCDSSCTSD